MLLNLTVSVLSATFWASNAVITAQILRLSLHHARNLHLYASVWYRPAVLYGLIASIFVVTLTIQSMLAMTWVVITKWLVIGRRREGSFPWDTSSYCESHYSYLNRRILFNSNVLGQRWQVHLTLSRPLYRGGGLGGVLSPLTGSAYIVW